MRASRYLLATAVVLACVGGFSTPNEAEDRVCHSATSFEVRELYANYADFLRRGDVESLTGLYSPDAILMGPAADTIRLGRAEIATYYTAFLQRTPSVTPLERVVRTDCGALGDAGTESMVLRLDSNRELTVNVTSRFSLSYARFGDRWLIVHHHQEILDGVQPSDVPLAGVRPSRVTTGANPPPPGLSAAQTVIIPPSPVALPTSAPVILSGQPPLVALPTAAVIDHPTIERLVELARNIPISIKPISVDVVVPPAKFALARSAPDFWPSVATVPAQVPVREPVALAQPAPQLVGTPKIDKAEPQAVAVVVPALPFPMPLAPPVIATVAPSMKAKESAPARLPAPEPKPPLKPAVAGFTQRASPPPSPPPRPIAPAAALPKPVSTVPAVQPKSAVVFKPVTRPPANELPTKTGKFLRWEEKTPIFDD